MGPLNDMIHIPGADQIPWLRWAQTEMGTREIPGPGWRLSNKRIEWYHAATAAGAAPDSVPWCSSFLCRAFQDATVLEHTRSKAAASWLGWGVATEIGLGAIGVMKTAQGHHCGIVAGYDVQFRPVLLGGNQSDQVRLTAYPFQRFLGFRLPPGYDLRPLGLVHPGGADDRTR